MPYVRLPGKSERYVNENDPTDTISRRQYDKRFGVLAKEGFSSYEARGKAKKYTVSRHTRKNPPHDTAIHHTYDLGLPEDLKKAVAFIIDSSPQFGNKMFLIVELAEAFDHLRKWRGKTFMQHSTEFATNVYGKSKINIDSMINDLKEAFEKYGIVYAALGYRLVLIDRGI